MTIIPTAMQDSNHDVSPDVVTDTSAAFHKLPYVFAKKSGLLALEENGVITVYHLPHVHLEDIAECQRVLSAPFTCQMVNEKTFQEHLAQCYEVNNNIVDMASGMEDVLDLSYLAGQLQASEDLLDTQDDAPVIKLINALLTQAIKQKASDIHIETYERHIMVRFRIDGVLQEILEISRTIAPLVISRIKVMAKLDIAEKRIPQDGRIALRIGGHAIDVRVSTLPSTHSERIVLRILDKQAAQLDLSLLGMHPEPFQAVKTMIAEPHGIVLVTGPTGSGKTTSLYAMLTSLNESTRNILTIEDPIEYDLPGIGQTQVNTKVEMTFAKGLRAILRQDPDIVMIGEIRDLETADIAVQASLTGHLVLSTLHTNTALGAITRLHDMGVEPFLLASSLVGLIAQRLVRKLCTYCKKPATLTEDERALLSMEGMQDLRAVSEPLGCHHCHHTGFSGRTGIYEAIRINEDLRGMIHRQEGLQQIEQHIRPHTASIRQDGFRKVLEGETSLAEILRVTSQS